MLFNMDTGPASWPAMADGSRSGPRHCGVVSMSLESRIKALEDASRPRRRVVSTFRDLVLYASGDLPGDGSVEASPDIQQLIDQVSQQPSARASLY